MRRRWVAGTPFSARVMGVSRLDPARLREVLEQLEQARDAHARWHEGIVRAVVCRQPPDPHDVAGNSHHECSFGRWYYHVPPSELRDHPAFAAMQAEHERLHRFAARMLRAAATAAPVPPDDFDHYMAARDNLVFELDSLLREIRGLLGSRDSLTGAHRRLDLLAELRELLELSRRGVQNCCIAFMDLDSFKAINDSHGHRVGDQVLAAAASFVMTQLRPFDKLYRYGGDEFLICMQGADLATGHAVVERIREGLGTLPLARADGRPVHVTASFGVAWLDQGLSVEESVDNADRALFAAKNAGRNRACCWDPGAATLSGQL
jgi:diguanylate cyclase